MFITCLLVIAGVELSLAQGPPGCPPPPNDLVTNFSAVPLDPIDPSIVTGLGCGSEIREGRAASKINSVDWIRKSSRWLPTCQGVPYNITLPPWHIVNGSLCYTPPIFLKFTYPSIRCSFTPCRGIKPSNIFERPYCRAENYKRYTACIFCVGGHRFYKRRFHIHTYRCCSCCRYSCPVITPGK